MNGHCPGYVFANAHDYAYGRFLLDKKSLPSAMAALRGAAFFDIFERTLLWASSWDSVREAK